MGVSKRAFAVSEKVRVFDVLDFDEDCRHQNTRYHERHTVFNGIEIGGRSVTVTVEGVQTMLDRSDEQKMIATATPLIHIVCVRREHRKSSL